MSVACGCAAVVTLAQAAPVASARWSPPSRLSARGGVATYPEVAFDGAGNAVATWAQLDPNSQHLVLVARRGAGSRQWTVPVRLSVPGIDSNYPQIALAPSGRAVVVWQAGGAAPSSGGGRTYIAATVESSPGASWSQPVAISVRSESAFQAEVSIDKHGDATAIWASGGGKGNATDVSSLAAGGQGWSAPLQIATSTQPLLSPEIAETRSGALVAVWKRWTGGGVLNPGGVRDRIEASVKIGTGHGWSRRVDLGPEVEPTGQGSASFEFPGPHLAMDAKGNAIAVWQARGKHDILVHASVWSVRTQRWRDASSVSTQAALWPHVAANPRGAVTVIWQGSNGSIEVATGRIDGRHWSQSQTLSSRAGTTFYPRVAMDGFADAIASWSQSGKSVQVSTRRGAHGSWHRAVSLGAPNGGVSSLAIDPHGTALALWQQPTEHPSGIVIDAAAYAIRRY